MKFAEWLHEEESNFVLFSHESNFARLKMVTPHAVVKEYAQFCNAPVVVPESRPVNPPPEK